MRGRGAGLSKRLDAVLDRVITDAQTAERALDYALSGSHVAFIAWLDDPNRPLELADAERRVARMQGVRDALLVPRDERTLYGWLHTPDGARIDEWMMVREVESRGSPRRGDEGLRGSPRTCGWPTGAVIAACKRETPWWLLKMSQRSASSSSEGRVERLGRAGWRLADLGGPRAAARALRVF
jgi:hypothetical protein